MLKRKIYDILKQWKDNSSKKALCLIGTRQVGKTTVVREFAKQEYHQLIELNFLEDPKAKEIFEGSLSAENILVNLSAFTEKSLIEHHTLILFDEIQECPNARTAIKFLVEDGRYDYIETGSMLGVKITEIKSYPVGFEQIENMYPLDFEEFLWANQISEAVIKRLKQNYQAEKPVSESLHHTMLELFKRYLVVGGMPEVINVYLETKNMQSVLATQQKLIRLFQNDIRKYAQPSARHSILEIFNAIPAQLNDQNRRYVLSQVIPKAKISRYENEFLWLVLAGIALPSYALAEPQPPFELNTKRSLFRLFLFDTGLLCAMSLGNIQFPILQGEFQINAGSIVENFFATQIVSNQFPLYYYNTKKIGELDFLIQQKIEPTILEIKSGKDYKKHNALNKALAIKNWKFHEGIVFCESNIFRENNILYLPFYMIMFLKPDPPVPYIFPELDLSDLEKNIN